MRHSRALHDALKDVTGDAKIQILYFSANAGRGTNERRTRRNRTQDETRPNAGRRSPKSIGSETRRSVSRLLAHDLKTRAATAGWHSPPPENAPLPSAHTEKRRCKNRAGFCNAFVIVEHFFLRFPRKAASLKKH